MKVLDQHKENKIKHKKLLQNLKNTLANVTEQILSAIQLIRDQTRYFHCSRNKISLGD